jgi:hypothetical protein
VWNFKSVKAAKSNDTNKPDFFFKIYSAQGCQTQQVKGNSNPNFEPDLAFTSNESG